MRLLRLPGRKNCDRVRAKGALWKGRHVNVRWLPGHPYHLSAPPKAAAVYAGVLSSTKLDKSSVKRNVMRRRCREALRLLMKGREPAFLSGAEPRSVQLLLLPRSSSLRCTFSELVDDLSRFLSSVRP